MSAFLFRLAVLRLLVGGCLHAGRSLTAPLGQMSLEQIAVGHRRPVTRRWRWQPDGYPANLAYSPELWDWMASLGFGLTYDPSHRPWLGIDPLDALEHALGDARPATAKDPRLQAAVSHSSLSAQRIHPSPPCTLGGKSRPGQVGHE